MPFSLQRFVPVGRGFTLAALSAICLPVGATIGRPRAFDERPYKQISAEIFFSLPICVIMVLTKSLALWERWRRSRRRGRGFAQRTLSPAIAGALPQGEPLDACIFKGMGFARSLCNTKAKLAINGTSIRTHLLDKMAVQILGRLNYLGK